MHRHNLIDLISLRTTATASDDSRAVNDKWMLHQRDRLLSRNFDGSIIEHCVAEWQWAGHCHAQGSLTLRAWSDPPCTRLSFQVKRCNRSCQSQLCEPAGLDSRSYSQVILAASLGKAMESSSPDAAFSAKKSALRRTVTRACSKTTRIVSINRQLVSPSHQPETFHHKSCQVSRARSCPLQIVRSAVYMNGCEVLMMQHPAVRGDAIIAAWHCR